MQHPSLTAPATAATAAAAEGAGKHTTLAHGHSWSGQVRCDVCSRDDPQRAQHNERYRCFTKLELFPPWTTHTHTHTHDILGKEGASERGVKATKKVAVVAVGRSVALPLLHANQAGLDFRACIVVVRRVRGLTHRCSLPACLPASQPQAPPPTLPRPGGRGWVQCGKFVLLLLSSDEKETMTV